MIENKSGIRPVRYSVIILPDVLEQKTPGGIIKPDHLQALEQNAQVKGTIVSVSDKAFTEGGFSDNEKMLLIPGARVYFAKYGEGTYFEGADGQEYRMMNDINVCGLIEDEMAVPVAFGRNRSKLSAV